MSGVTAAVERVAARATPGKPLDRPPGREGVLNDAR